MASIKSGYFHMLLLDAYIPVTIKDTLSIVNLYTKARRSMI